MGSMNPSLETLQRLRPLVEFEKEQLLALAKELNVQTAHKKEEILSLGSTEEESLFVLEGNFEMNSGDGKRTNKTVSDTELLNPIAQLRPSMYQIKAVKSVQYLKIPNALLTQYSSFGNEEEVDVVIMEDDPTIQSKYMPGQREFWEELDGKPTS